MQHNEPLNIIGICGSLRSGSYTRQALCRTLDVIARGGTATTMLADATLQLPLCDGSPPESHAAVVQLREHVHQAHALIVASPEYCGTYSAVIKNVIEWLSPALLQHKVVGLLAVAEGLSAQGALAGLQHVCLAQGAWVLPYGVAMPLVQDIFTHPTRSFAQQQLQQLDRLGSSMLEAVQLFQREARVP